MISWVYTAYIYYISLYTPTHIFIYIYRSIVDWDDVGGGVGGRAITVPYSAILSTVQRGWWCAAGQGGQGAERGGEAGALRRRTLGTCGDRNDTETTMYNTGTRRNETKPQLKKGGEMEPDERRTERNGSDMERNGTAAGTHPPQPQPRDATPDAIGCRRDQWAARARLAGGVGGAVGGLALSRAHVMRWVGVGGGV